LIVVRAFGGEDVTHVEDSVDPARDLDTITAELCAKDIVYVARMRAERELDVKKNPKMKLPPLFFTVMDKVQELLENNHPIGKAEWTAPEIEKINELIPLCLTTKPMVYLINCSKKDLFRGNNKHLVAIKNWIDAHGGGLAIPFSIEFEEEHKALSDAGDADGMKEMVSQLKLGKGSVIPRIIKCGYKELQLQYYFTAGEKEVRCWTIMKGALAPSAAGVIHGDFEKNFIKAECVSYADFEEHGGGTKGMAEVKAAGKYRQEGKSYVVQDGDIINFQIGTSGGKK